MRRERREAHENSGVPRLLVGRATPAWHHIESSSLRPWALLALLATVLFVVGVTTGGRSGLVGLRTEPDSCRRPAGYFRAEAMAKSWPMPERVGPAGVRVAGAAGRQLAQGHGRGALVSDWRSLIGEYLWPVEEAIAIFRCESVNFRADVVYGPTEGRAGERGVAQLHPVHAAKFYTRGWTWDDAFRPERNLAIAYQIWLDQGWAPWTCWDKVRGY